MQQQQQASQQGEEQQAIPQRGPFPWGRVIVVFIIFFVLVLLAGMGLLAYGHVIDYIWVFLAPPLGGLISAIVTVLAWCFPFNSISSQPALQDHPQSQPQSQTQSVSDSTNAAQRPQASSSISNSPLHQSAVPAGHIFHYNEPELLGPDEFYDRQYERTTLIERSSHRASTAIMGDYRIGKSWLMQYLQQIAPTHPQLGPHVRVGRLNATNPQCQTLAGFTKRALEMLNFPARDPHPNETPLERLTSTRGLKTFRSLSDQCLSLIGPFEGLSHRAIVIVDEGQDFGL